MPQAVNEAKLYQDAFEQTAIPICWVAYGGDIIKANSAYWEMLGYNPAEQGKRNAWDFLPTDDVARARALVQNDIATGNTSRFEIVHRIVREDGSLLWVRAS